MPLFANKTSQTSQNTTSNMPSQEWEKLKEDGNNAFKNSAWDEAVELYTRALKIKSDEPILYSNRSAVHLKKGNYIEAAEDAKKAIELNTHFVKAYTRMYGALSELGEFAEARQILSNGINSLTSMMVSQTSNTEESEKANALKSTTMSELRTLREMHRAVDNADKAIHAAVQLLLESKYDEAKSVLAQPVSTFPSCRQLCLLWAEARAPSEPDEANKILMPLSSTSMEDPKYLYLRALASYYRGQDGFKSAQLILRQALELDPDYNKAMSLLKKIRHIEAHKEAGNAAFKLKKAADAIREYTAAIDEDVSNIRMHATLRGNRAAARMELHDYTGALLDCDYAINHGFTSAKLYARRSRVEEQLEKFDDALRDMQQAVELDKSFTAELRSLKVRAKRGKRKDYYKTLGLTTGENDDNAIKRAYKKACLQWHPDKWANTSEEEKLHAERQFKEVGEAFGVLSDRKKKRMYDSGQMDNDVIDGSSAEGGVYGFPSQNDQFAQMFQYMFSDGGGGGGGGSSGFQTQFVFGNASPFVSQSFTRGGRRRQRGMQMDPFDF